MALGRAAAWRPLPARSRPVPGAGALPRARAVAVAAAHLDRHADDELRAVRVVHHRQRHRPGVSEPSVHHPGRRFDRQDAEADRGVRLGDLPHALGPGHRYVPGDQPRVHPRDRRDHGVPELRRSAVAGHRCTTWRHTSRRILTSTWCTATASSSTRTARRSAAGSCRRTTLTSCPGPTTCRRRRCSGAGASGPRSAPQWTRASASRAIGTYCSGSARPARRLSVSRASSARSGSTRSRRPRNSSRTSGRAR